MAIVSPHGIATPKGLYFTAVVSSFFLLFSTPNSLRWLNESQPNLDTYSLMTAIWKIWSDSHRHTPPRAGGQKPPFWDRFWTLTDHISATEHNINNRKETCCQSTWTLLRAPKFDELWSRNGWERLASFAPIPKFSHWDTLPALPHGRYITDSRQTLARAICSDISLV